MPIKLPKGFQRRKSSGNALDEVQNPPVSSFKVLGRTPSEGKSFDGGVSLRMGGPMVPKPTIKNRLDREEEDVFTTRRPDAGNRGSAGTQRSLSTAPNDSAASSARLSTSSTNPSSIETRSEHNVQSSSSQPPNDVPVQATPTASSGFLRSPPRALSFGMSKGGQSTPTSPQGDLPPQLGKPRNRTATASTASTATPPRLFDSDLVLDNSELDGFGNMFDHIRSSPDPGPVRLIPQAVSLLSPTSYPPTSYSGAPSAHANRASAPKPIHIDRTQVVESSPYSWTSHDGLIQPPSPSKTVTEGSPVKSARLENQSSNPSPKTRFPTRRPVGQRLPTEERFDQTTGPLLQSNPADINLLSMSPTKTSAKNIEGNLSPSSTHSATFDPSIMADAELANMYQERKIEPPKPISTNKVMTPAQWERYKQQKEMDRRLGALSDDSGSDHSDEYDDEDELERDRQATKQRRKQEAHLAVYRQQMMKVTGEKSPSRPASSLSVLQPRNLSSNDLNNRLSDLSIGSKQSRRNSAEDDEDEDIPLGILAAHGFPNKNRPPTRLETSPSNSNFRAVSQGQAAPSLSGQAPKGGNLPPFARNLPHDPYYGASLVNPSNRESLAIHGSPPSSGARASTAHPLHPAGLVGVIAGEERARAARRGSPNASGNYEMSAHPAMVRSQTTGSFAPAGYPAMGMPGMPQTLTPGDQAQIQMSQQMAQMMHMQMQWMQQMQQMMSGQTNANSPMPPQFGMQRPHSMHLQDPPTQQAGQRTMSALNPSLAPWNTNQPFVPSINVNGQYAPSIAPSERSNVGLASRYRPVSIAPEPDINATRRASTFTSSTTRPWSQLDIGAVASAQTGKSSANLQHRKATYINQDDEDDEQGWAEMKMKKDKKQKSWALRKGDSALQELYNNASA
ncbi:hypothetical protein LTR10_023186 [Elasticomyces elasticus]|uniref:Uncharacterized protein n=1 Tax=Exophiala sideris TaxID=1016849 RepID=A0ABR0J4A3_9EURO|nr:hypothetical protein LTR10_023186 [Elasticomyces elasticus]KAK5024171.1 hypothetical protein LTS07_008906 [Exophiala sideris]KAK5028969.1 hypothetical protein LTR13_008838 [Exophiala sideris]KAK5054883.1 hypothetical protein LTR69_008791 [Exophiala sideris]KAK5178792.1 hypothetical protein LTR44_008619 [Eurotiomycetes sp. CCFEE 6388]